LNEAYYGKREKGTWLKYTGKKEMVKRAIIWIIHNKIIEFTSRRMYKYKYKYK
jgi:hypothetical protein